MNTGNFRLDFRSDQDRWKRLLDEIEEGNVIPVIGADLLTEPKLIRVGDHAERVENLHQQLVSYIAAQTNVQSTPRTFSQLVYDENYRQVVREEQKIYNLIYQLLSNVDKIDEIDNRPSRLLMDLLGTKKFPFVITTSFTPVVEDAMREIWGDVKVLNFDNNPQNSTWERNGDIRSISELKQPTVFYMFGKYCDNSRDVRFVVTDSDMMKFCSAWIRGNGIPKNLTEALKNKYLLILGNNYSDWLFRFVWYGLRNSTTSGMKSDVVVKDSAEESFKQFLCRLETFFQENPAEVVQRIKKEMDGRVHTSKPNDVYTTYDVFISYSRSDNEVARTLYQALSEKGLKVWMDDKSIRPAESWREAISNGIHNTCLFVPILSKNIENEAMIPHEYREEWKTAASLSSKMGGRTFIIPFVEKDFDFYSRLTRVPDEFTEKNAVWFDDAADMETITSVVVKELEVLKQMEQKLK